MAFTKKSIFLLIGIIVSGVLMFLLIKIMLNKKSDDLSEEAENFDKKAEKDRKNEIQKIEKQIIEIKAELKRKGIKTERLNIGKEFDEYLRKNNALFRNKKIVLINAANESFSPGAGGLNNAVTQYVRNKGGLDGDHKWNGFEKLYIKGFPNRAAFSRYSGGYVLHIVGFKASELQTIKLNIESVSTQTKTLLLKSLIRFANKFIFEVRVFFVPFISSKIFAGSGKDAKGIAFSTKEFKLRAMLGVYQFLNEYNGNYGEVILNKGGSRRK